MARALTVYLKVQEEIADLVMNRPEVLNAENWQFIDDFHAALDQLEAAPNLRAVIVSGEGKAFSAGIDLTALAEGKLQIDWFRRFDEALLRLEQLKPLTVAKMHGYAIGGGLQIALACDLRLTTPETRLGLTAVLEALIPGMGTYRLPRFIGLGRARRMILTGELISADEALRIGLVDWVVPKDKLDNATRSIITVILKGSATARNLAMKLVTGAFESTFQEAFTTYLECQAESLSSTEHIVAMNQYRQRRTKRDQ